MKTCLCAAAAALLAPSGAAIAAADDENHPEIVVTAARPDQAAPPPNTAVTIDAATIRARVNAINVEDTLRYVPGLILRKRHIGDNFAPIATRTSGLGSSARSLVYADGILLSALINNNNGNGSPKWQLVAPQEVARIDVLYGPYSAAYPGNAIGAVVNITTREPETLEARIDLTGNLQHHRQYATARDFGTGQMSGSIGDRIGNLAIFASATRTISNGPPVVYVTAAAAPTGTTGAIPTTNRLGQPIAVLGAADIDHHVQDTFKFKLAWQLGAALRATYTGVLFRDDSTAAPDTYLRDPAGQPVYTTGFNAGTYRRTNRHWAHALSLRGTGPALDWQLVGSLYDYARDQQANPTGLLPAAATRGAGLLQDQAGTGWVTLDARADWHRGGRDRNGLAGNLLSFGAHVDRYSLQARTYASASWRDYAETSLTAAALGKTRTAALWFQDQVHLPGGLALTVGARQEWWEAFDGFNQTTPGSPGLVQARRSAQGLSPKASLAWRDEHGWTARLSLAQAWRFPTVGELYGATTVGAVLANPNPTLRPERARSAELAIEHRSERGSLRLSLFSETVHDALIAQTGTVTALQPGGTSQSATASFVQNVEHTRARGAELAVEQRDLVRGFDLAGSVTFAQAITRRDPAFPAAEGKLLPGVPRWKANAMATWRPDARWTLTAAARLASRVYATLDNSDSVVDTYQGFDRFLVIDLRATWQATRQLQLAVGVDNANNDRYFLFHPFPQRSVTAELHWML